MLIKAQARKKKEFKAFEMPKAKRFKALNSPEAWLALLELSTIATEPSETTSL